MGSYATTDRSILKRSVIPINLIVFFLSILPVLVTSNPPLHDYQFHIARMDILRRWAHSPDLRSYYDFYTMLLPNVGMDAVVLLLAQVIPVEWAGRVFIILTFAVQLFGCLALNRALLRLARVSNDSTWPEQIGVNLLPLLAAFFLYNWIFLFGFLNYLFGLGLVLLAMAAWIELDIVGKLLPKLFFGTLCALVLYFCHLIALGLFAIMVAGYQLPRAWAIRPIRPALGYLLSGAVIFMLPAALFLTSPTNQGTHFTSHSLTNLLRTPAIFVRVLMAGTWSLDLLLLLMLVLMLPLLRRVRVMRPMRLPLVLLFVTYLAMPHELFGGWGADSRIPVLIVFVFCGSIYLREPPSRVEAVVQQHRVRRFGYCLLAMLTLRCAILTMDWIAYDHVYADFRTAFRKLPAGSVIFSASTYPPPSLQDLDLHLWQPPLASVVALAVLEVHDVFVPQVWATYGQQPIAVTPRYQPLYALQNNVARRVTTDAELQQWGAEIRKTTAQAKIAAPVFLLLLYPNHFDNTMPHGMRVVASGRDFVLLSL